MSRICEKCNMILTNELLKSCKKKGCPLLEKVDIFDKIEKNDIGGKDVYDIISEKIEEYIEK